MIDYKNYLDNNTVRQLKDIVRKYKLTGIIKLSKVRKDYLINELLKHTTLKKSGIYRNEEVTNNISIYKEKKVDDNKFNEEEMEILRRISKHKLILDKVKNIDIDNDNDIISNEDEEIKIAYVEYKKALYDYKKFKLY